MSRKTRHSHVSHERWLVSYADFITLLFAFFVVMFASSRQDHTKVKQVESSIREAFQSMGVFPAASNQSNRSSVVVPPARAIPSEGDLEAMALAMEDLRNLERRMQRTLAPQIAHGTVTVNLGPTGLLISLSSAGFFESGSAVPIASSLPALNEIGHAIATTPYDVRIEGHTDNVPIHNAQYSDNWELSTARATELTRLFIEEDNIVPVRLSAAGYAQYHPIASNLTEQGRSRNRRVDIIVLPTSEPAAVRQLAKPDLAGTTFSEKSDPKQLQDLLLRASHAAVPSTTMASSRRAR